MLKTGAFDVALRGNFLSLSPSAISSSEGERVYPSRTCGLIHRASPGRAFFERGMDMENVVSVVVMGRYVGIWDQAGNVIKRFKITSSLRETVKAYLRKMSFVVNNTDSFTWLDEFKATMEGGD